MAIVAVRSAVFLYAPQFYLLFLSVLFLTHPPLSLPLCSRLYSLPPPSAKLTGQRAALYTGTKKPPSPPLHLSPARLPPPHHRRRRRRRRRVCIHTSKREKRERVESRTASIAHHIKSHTHTHIRRAAISHQYSVYIYTKISSCISRIASASSTEKPVYSYTADDHHHEF